MMESGFQESRNSDFLAACCMKIISRCSDSFFHMTTEVLHKIALQYSPKLMLVSTTRRRNFSFVNGCCHFQAGTESPLFKRKKLPTQNQARTFVCYVLSLIKPTQRLGFQRWLRPLKLATTVYKMEIGFGEKGFEIFIQIGHKIIKPHRLVK